MKKKILILAAIAVSGIAAVVASNVRMLMRKLKTLHVKPLPLMLKYLVFGIVAFITKVQCVVVGIMDVMYIAKKQDLRKDTSNSNVINFAEFLCKVDL